MPSFYVTRGEFQTGRARSIDPRHPGGDQSPSDTWKAAASLWNLVGGPIRAIPGNLGTWSK